MTAEHDLPRAEAKDKTDALFCATSALPFPTPEEMARREADREARAMALVKSSRLADNVARYAEACPPEFLSSDWEHSEIQPFRAQIDRILGYSLGQRGVLASGPTGRRKTGTLWALMHRLACVEGHECRFFSAHSFFSKLQEQVRYGHDDAGGWIEAIARRRVVFIDDYGQHQVTASKSDWAESWFFRFLDIRASYHLPLFMTTNLTGHDIAGSWKLRADPLIRRLLMVSDPVPFETDSERRERAR